MSQAARRAGGLAVHLDAARDEVERLREELVRLQARLEELEAAELARQETAPRRGLASLIPGGASKAG